MLHYVDILCGLGYIGGQNGVSWEEHTLIQSSLQLLSNSHELHSSPEIRTDILAYAKCPAAAQQVSPVFPYGLEAFLEQVDGLAHLDLVDGGVVVVAPEILDRLDEDVELLERSLVVLAIVRLLLLLLTVDGEYLISMIVISLRGKEYKGRRA